MKAIRSLLLSAALLTAAGLPAQTPSAWPAGEVVPAEAVAAADPESCFTARPLDEALVRRIDGHSYREGCPVALSELRYLRVLHVDAEGQTRAGELICHREIADDLLAIFRTLYEAGYPIERMVLVDDYGADDERSMRANNSSAFNYRRIAGSSRVSEHGYGRAVDINPLYNPYVRERDGRRTVSPAEGAPYADRSKPFPYKIEADDLCCREFRRRGFVWGGAWTSVKDYQHFEKPAAK